MYEYKIIETTADTGIKAKGTNYLELCRNMLQGFYAIAFGKNNNISQQIKNSTDKNKVSFENREEMIFILLNEAVFMLYTRNSIIYPLSITEDEIIYSIVENNKYIETEIKAATKHKLYVKKMDDKFEAAVILDI